MKVGLTDIRSAVISIGSDYSYRLACKALRATGHLPPSTEEIPSKIESIFFSFPYHSVGDTVLSLKLLDRVHKNWPAATIDFAVGRTMSSVIAESPIIRKTIEVPRSRFSSGLPQAIGNCWTALGALSNSYQGESYDLALAPRWEGRDSFQAAGLAFASGAAVRIGYDSRQSGGFGVEKNFLTQTVEGGAGEHESLRFMRLLGRCGLDRLGDVDDAEVLRPIAPLLQIVDAYSGPVLPRETRYAVLAPGASGDVRMWPRERFSSIGSWLSRVYGLQILVAGSPGERMLCESIADQIGPRAISIAGSSDPLQLLEILAKASIVLCNDSGPGHMAGGLGAPTIVLSPFPSTSSLDHFNAPSRFRPCGPLVRVLQPKVALSPCGQVCVMPFAHCINQITVEDVIAELEHGGLLV